MQKLRVRLPARQTNYEIKIGAGLLADVGRSMRQILGIGARRAALISNRRVFALFGNQVERVLRAAQFEVSVWLMKEGEPHKSLRSFEQALSFMSQTNLERNDAVIALGGGVVGDVGGFAAATYLRGVAFIQIPTTLLAQIDASVGGKTGVNLSSGKNLVGAFHQPRLVLIDTDTLRTLPSRELTSGWCEAIKQGAAGDRKLFQRTLHLLRDKSRLDVSKRQISSSDLAATIAAHCRFKATIVAGDERESIDRRDRRSRRILNFGHTTAHALEAVTSYRRFRHGEAVGYGMLVAGEISKSLGMLASGELELLREGVRACGKLPRANNVDIDELMRAMKGDKKSIAGKVNWVLLETIGKARIINGDEISPRVLRAALQTGLK